MKKGLVLSSMLFLLFTITMRAQKNYLPGTIEFFNHDTIQGFIDYRAWDKSPEKNQLQKNNGGARC